MNVAATRGKILGYVLLAATMTVVGVVPVFAAEPEKGDVQRYSAREQLQFGTVVKLASDGDQTVIPASSAELQNMLGVVIDPNQVSLRFSGGTLQNETYVATRGTYNALVSTQGGDIVAGDPLTLSSINGVLMKAGTSESTIFGRAGKNFNAQLTTLGTKTLTDPATNATKEVALGSIPVTINITRNPNKSSTKANVPEFLERAGTAIAEKEVSPIRIYLSVAISVICLIAALVVIYAGVRNGVVSIGRNPMSRKSIFRALFEIMLTSMLILIIGLFAVYLLLKL